MALGLVEVLVPYLHIHIREICGLIGSILHHCRLVLWGKGLINVSVDKLTTSEDKGLALDFALLFGCDSLFEIIQNVIKVSSGDL
jgi:hypothetical protein